VTVLVQQNDGLTTTFDKTWSEYKAGFSDGTGNFWIGNDKLSQLTYGGCNQLTFVLQV
jgi:Fibrinogen beta and gamma chains, C-terminal globular domain